MALYLMGPRVWLYCNAILSLCAVLQCLNPRCTVVSLSTQSCIPEPEVDPQPRLL